MAIIVNYIVPPGINVAPLLGDPSVTMMERSEPYEVVRGYVQVRSFRWEKNLITFQLDYKRRRGESTVMSRQFIFEPDISPDAKSIHAQIYGYIKTLPEFEGAEDEIDEYESIGDGTV